MKTISSKWRRRARIYFSILSCSINALSLQLYLRLLFRMSCSVNATNGAFLEDKCFTCRLRFECMGANFVRAGAVSIFKEITVNISGTTYFTHNSASEYGGKNVHKISKCFGKMSVKANITVIVHMPIRLRSKQTKSN